MPAQWPEGVITCDIVLGKELMAGGSPVASDITLEIMLGGADSLVWTEAGIAMLAINETFNIAADALVTVKVPVTDQDGWVDNTLAPVTGWTYKLTQKFKTGATSRVKYVQPITGQTTLDFDMLPGGSPSTPIVGAIPAVSSVAGLSGAVSAPELAAALDPYIEGGGGGGGLTAEEIRDLVAAFIVQGTGITVTHNDAADTLTVAATASAPVWGGIGGTLGNQTDLNNALNLLAPKASPVFTGNPTAPTPTPGDNDTSIATTAFVTGAIATAVANLLNSAPGALDTLNELAAALGNDPDFAATISGQIAAKADDSAVVKLTTNQTIAGTKTFSSAPVVPANAFGIDRINGLTAALEGKQPTGSYAAASHSHSQSDITGLSTSLAGKAGAASTNAALWVGTEAELPASGSRVATTLYAVKP